ncbi:IucA/IucC family siderophore biosynthesis protein [Paenibacillus sp. YYML68]|uniref:IucA/IucC family protein n=1 Tax=Paenibacillus sp. YYML68 TaxID=2909250 RepID=UPI002493A5A1|nr:IucA/IucC family protein [Paenibacillus sp. YYML68]
MMWVDEDKMYADTAQTQAYVKVRRRIFRQLIESVLYEGIVPAEKGNATDGGADAFRLAGVSADVGSDVFVLRGFTAGGRRVQYRCRGAVRPTFGRFRLEEHGVVLRQVEGAPEEEACSLRQFVMEVLSHAQEAEPDRLLTFASELEHTLLNDTLAQQYREEQGLVLGQLHGYELESAAMDGHRYHPCYKSRIGFDTRDQLAYGPEFARDLRPYWLAIHKEEVRVSVIPGLTIEDHLERELGGELLDAFAAQLRVHDGHPDEYMFVPVHPWQWSKLLPSCLELLHTRRIVALGASEDEYRAQQSIRTWSNRTTPERANVKLAMNLVNTSSSRHLLPHYTATAPVMSQWLDELCASDAYLRDEARVVILREVAAVSFESQHGLDHADHSTAERDPLYGAIGCIWRESVERFLEPEESALSLFTLWAEERDGRLLIEPWLRQYGLEAWLQRLLECVMLPVMHLAAVHGVATEAHAQNMVLLHKNGWPERVALKDFHEDVLYCRSFLAEPQRCPKLESVHPRYVHAEARANFEVDRLEPLRYLTLGALLFVNLGELAMLLADRLGFSEDRFWELAVDTLERHGRRDPVWGSRLAELGLLAPSTRVEQLTYKRLTARSGGRMHTVPNPLWEAAARLNGERSVKR